ncbi:MAG: calcium/sodium antiporter [Kiritimatiellae bacterium]|nr:calcium/sodium antiporter [Kiritimatiellia bacterium]
MSIDSNIPLLLSLLFIAGGLFLLSWSADKFVEGSAAVARAFGVSPFVVGMVIIGFGTSAPELCVSTLSGLSGHANLSLGNAYGSCIFNLAAILGVAAMIRPLKVKPSVCAVAVPLLLGVTALSYFVVRDMDFSRMNGFILLGVFAVMMPLYCLYDQKSNAQPEEGRDDGAAQPVAGTPPLGASIFWVVAGLAMLVGSSHLLVWGCVDFARDVLHVSDLLIGLTVVAAGTSLPELASAIASARRGEHEFVIGNIVGSNLFNTLAVVGLAGSISPYANYSRYVVTRDIPVMAIMSLSILVFGLNWRNFRKDGQIERWEGALWMLIFVGYLAVMVKQEAGW